MGTPAAEASIWTGACPIEVNFSFNSRVRTATSLSAPTYTVSISNFLLPCAVTLNVNQPLRSTSGGGGGGSILWTCESTLAQGSWSQSWGSGFPAVTSGSHVITGTWGAWTMAVASSSLNFAGVAELTISPFEPVDKLAECELAGIRDISMVGTMVFQDPELPG